MSRKKSLLVLLVLVCVILAVSYMGLDNLGGNTGNQPQNNPPESQPQDNPAESQPQDKPPDLPEGVLFTVPESPLGTLGVILALVTAFGIFFVKAKKSVVATK